MEMNKMSNLEKMMNIGPLFADLESGEMMVVVCALIETLAFAIGESPVNVAANVFMTVLSKNEEEEECMQ